MDVRFLKRRWNERASSHGNLKKGSNGGEYYAGTDPELGRGEKPQKSGQVATVTLAVVNSLS